MKNSWKLLPLAALAVMLFGCGGGGGTASPEDVARAAAKAIKSESSDDLYGLLPHHMSDAGYRAARREYEIKEGYSRWKDVKDGVEKNDPEEKSGIKDEDSWKSCSAERWYALQVGAYRIMSIKKYEDRVKNAEWYMTDSEIKTVAPGGEDHRTADVRFRNIYGDSISVSCIEDQGLWYMTGIELNFAEELPKPPED
jgi:hypothetical protein